MPGNAIKWRSIPDFVQFFVSFGIGDLWTSD
jgi:hypothetical protein